MMPTIYFSPHLILYDAHQSFSPTKFMMPNYHLDLLIIIIIMMPTI